MISLRLQRAHMESRARSYLTIPMRIELAFAKGLLGVFSVLEHLFENAILARVDSVMDDLDDQLPQVLARVPLLYAHMAQSVRVENLEAIRRALGLHPGGELDVERAILEGRERTIRLVEDAAQEYAAAVRTLFEDPRSFSMTIEELTAELQATAKISNARAKLIAVDQTHKLNAAINQARQQALGISQYVWLTMQDERVRKTHKANDNRVFAWDAPSDVTGHPGHDPNCRCIAVGIVPKFAGERL